MAQVARIGRTSNVHNLVLYDPSRFTPLLRLLHIYYLGMTCLRLQNGIVICLIG